MSIRESAVEKPHATGTWRAIRSRAVPANVTTLDANSALAATQSEPRPTTPAGVEILLTRQESGAYIGPSQPARSGS